MRRDQLPEDAAAVVPRKFTIGGKGFFWTEVNSDDSFVMISVGTDESAPRFEFPGNGIFLDRRPST